MSNKRKARVSDAPKLCPADLLVCPKCGYEFSILPRVRRKAVCPKCNWSSTKSGFVPLIAKRTVWVSKEMLLQYHQQVTFKHVMEGFHRVVDIYRELFIRDVDMRAMKSAGFFVYGCAVGIRSVYNVDISWEEAAQFVREHMNATPLFKLLDSAKVGLGSGHGRPPRSERLVLLIDAMLLSLYPDGYLRFLQDALTLRYKEYAISPTYARAHRDRWKKFRQSKRAAEVYCRRIWMSLFDSEPVPPPEDWDLDVAREQGLMENGCRGPA